MKLISHRGNISEKNEETENTVKQIEYAISLGYDVEIDLWSTHNIFYLGHNRPSEFIHEDIIYKYRDKLWCHAKNDAALIKLGELENVNYFVHDQDRCVLTSKKYIWSYKNILIPQSIMVMPDKKESIEWVLSKKCVGVCADNIEYFRKELNV